MIALMRTKHGHFSTLRVHLDLPNNSPLSIARNSTPSQDTAAREWLLWIFRGYLFEVQRSSVLRDDLATHGHIPEITKRRMP